MDNGACGLSGGGLVGAGFSILDAGLGGNGLFGGCDGRLEAVLGLDESRFSGGGSLLWDSFVVGGDGNARVRSSLSRVVVPAAV